MDAISYSDLRQNLKSYMDKVYDDNDALIITRKDKKNIVLLSVEEYNSLIETSYLLSNEENAAHLRKSIDQYKTGKIKNRKLLNDE